MTSLTRRSVLACGIALAATPKVLRAAAGEPNSYRSSVRPRRVHWPAADIGERRRSTAAAKWLNKRGGIAGRPIEVSTIDTETKVDVGISRLRQLLQERNVDFVIGSQHGGVAVTSNPIMQEQKRLYLSMSRTDSNHGVRRQSVRLSRHRQHPSQCDCSGKADGGDRRKEVGDHLRRLCMGPVAPGHVDPTRQRRRAVRCCSSFLFR